jgi:hypothetical protein
VDANDPIEAYALNLKEAAGLVTLVKREMRRPNIEAFDRNTASKLDAQACNRMKAVRYSYRRPDQARYGI